MDKLKKVGLTALGTALVSTSAVAADLAVTGGAKLTFVGGDKADTGNGWSMTDSITFAGSADLDNGWTISTSQNTSAGTHNNAETSINMGDMGTIQFWKSSGTSVPGSWDDMMPAANEESWNGLTGDTAGVGAIMAAGANDDLFRYSVNVMDGIDLYASYSGSDGQTLARESSSSLGVKYTGIEGLTVGFARGENNEKIAVTNGLATSSAATFAIENTVLYVTYAFDSFTIGVQDNDSDSDSTASADQAYRGYGISYAVTEDISVSYGQGTVDFQKANSEDQETTAVGISYTSGGITVSGSMHDGENLGGSAATTADKQAYELNIAFAF